MNTKTITYYQVQSFYKGGTTPEPVWSWVPEGIAHSTETLAREALAECNRSEFRHAFRVVRVTEETTTEVVTIL